MDWINLGTCPALLKTMFVMQDGSHSFDLSNLTDLDKDILSHIE